MSGLGFLCTMYGYSSHLSAILCFPSNATILTRSLSPSSTFAPRVFKSVFLWLSVMTSLLTGITSVISLVVLRCIWSWMVDSHYLAQMRCLLVILVPSQTLSNMVNGLLFLAAYNCGPKMEYGSSSRISDRFFKVPSIFIKVLLNLSVIPFPIGWYGVVLVFLMLSSLQSSWMVLLSNCGPWSPCKTDGIPYCITKFLKSASVVVLAVRFFVGMAWAYLVKWSVITRMFCIPHLLCSSDK